MSSDKYERRMPRSEIYIPGTQMTLVLIGKDLVLKGSTTKIEDKQVPGIHTPKKSPYSK